MEKIAPGKNVTAKKVTPIVKPVNAVAPTYTAPAAIESKVWKNNDVKIIDCVTCIIPRTIVEAMMYLDNKFTGVEFSIFGICTIGKNNKITLEETFYIPEQVVTSSEVDYKEDAPAGFNCVIHKHPSGLKNFSGTDDTYINNNFDYSLLWVDGKFETGQVRVKTPMGYVKVKMNFSHLISIPDISKDQLAKVTKKTYVVPQYTNQYGGYAHGAGNQYGEVHQGRYGVNKNRKWVNGKWVDGDVNWVKAWGDPAGLQAAADDYYDAFQGGVKHAGVSPLDHTADIKEMFGVESVDDLDEIDIDALNAMGYNFRPTGEERSAADHLNSVD